MLDEVDLQQGLLGEEALRELLRQTGKPLATWLPFAPFRDAANWLPAIAPPCTEPLDSLVNIKTYHATLDIEWQGMHILVDPGLGYIPEVEPRLILVTHAHADHAAGLATCCERFPTVPVILTEITATVLGHHDIALAHALQRQAVFIRSGDALVIRNVTLRAWAAGHLLGACMFDALYEGKCIRITGDFSMRAVGEIAGMLPPSPANLLLMSASHAWDIDSSFASATFLALLLAEKVEDAIKVSGAPVALVGNTLGECQEAYCALLRSKMQGKFGGIRVGLGNELRWSADLYKRANTAPYSPWALPFHPAMHFAGEVAIHSLNSVDELTHTNILYPQVPAQATGESVYPISTHASFGELMTFALLSKSGVVGLYHGQALDSSPLARFLRMCSRHVIALNTSPLSIH